MFGLVLSNLGTDTTASYGFQDHSPALLDLAQNILGHRVPWGMNSTESEDELFNLESHVRRGSSNQRLYPKLQYVVPSPST